MCIMASIQLKQDRQHQHLVTEFFIRPPLLCPARPCEASLSRRRGKLRAIPDFTLNTNLDSHSTGKKGVMCSPGVKRLRFPNYLSGLGFVFQQQAMTLRDHELCLWKTFKAPRRLLLEQSIVRAGIELEYYLCTEHSVVATQETQQSNAAIGRQKGQCQYLNLVIKLYSGLFNCWRI